MELLAQWLAEHASRHFVPGAAVGLVLDDAVSTGYVGTADVASGESVTAETRFAVGSLAKSVVATAVARLAELGELAFDDPIAMHVPELRGSEWAEADTLRDLLANRSRVPLRNEIEFGTPTDVGDDALSRFTARIAASASTKGVWSYANAGWCVLGRALETVTGLTWEDAMRVHVFDPLGMEGATFVNAPVAEPRASGHTATADGAEPVAPWSPRSLGPAGSTLLCTLTDVLGFARAHVKEPTLAVLRSTQSEVRIHAWLDAWCLGWARFDWGGGTVWGWDGLISGQRAILRLVPDRGAAVLLTNSDRGRALYRSLFAELMPDAFGIAVPPLALEPSERFADLSRFAGVYAWPDRRLEVTATDSGLAIVGDGRTLYALPIDERTFVVNPDDPDEPTVTFDRFDESGRPAVLYSMLWGLPRA